MVLRMFEELGMPILHIGKCVDCSLSYFWESIPTESYFASCTDDQVNATDFESCNTDPLYPVDVWLYDHRTRASINNEDFAIAFPDLAVQSGQFVEWPIGGRKITPRHAIEILKSVGPMVAGSNRIHAETACVPDLDVTSDAHRQSGSGIKGAGAGEYSCYNPDTHNVKYFQGCSSGEGDEEKGDEKTPGACYDMGSHQCSCDPERCTAELCSAKKGIWTADCPDHCTECSPNEADTTPTVVDAPQEPTTTSNTNGDKVPADDSPAVTSNGDKSSPEEVSLESIAFQTTVLNFSTMVFSMTAFCAVLY